MLYHLSKSRLRSGSADPTGLVGVLGKGGITALPQKTGKDGKDMKG